MEKGNKSGRSFDLEKGAKRSFDLEKKPTRRFDLSKENEAESETAGPSVAGSSAVHSHSSAKQTTTGKTSVERNSNSSAGAKGKSSEIAGESQNTKDKKKNRILIPGAIVVIALIVGATFLFKGTDNEDKTIAPPVVEQTGLPADEKPDETAVIAAEPENTQEATEKMPTQVQPETSSQVNVETPTKKQQRELPQAEPTINKTPTPQLASIIEEQAKQVIRGDFGNGEERKQKLGAAYSEVQRKVNEMYRAGNWKQ